MGRIFNNNLFLQENGGGGTGGTTNYDDLTNKPAIDGVVLTKNTTKADLGITTGGAEKYGIKGDYASKYGIINAQNGLITYTSDSKEVTVKAGIQLLMPGSDTKTQIGSDIKYTINSTSDVTLFLADGEVKEAEGVYFQTEEPENGQEAYLAWYNPEVGKWQFKSNDDGNVWRTPTKAGPLADVHLSETGVIRVDYVGYRVLNDQIFALKSDLPVNAYTASNLVSGKNITIEEVLPEGGIDEHTLACWHFDGNTNYITGSGEVKESTIVRGDASIDSSFHKFGTGSVKSGGEGAKIRTIQLSLAQSFTYDFWLLKRGPSNYSAGIGFCNIYVRDTFSYLVYKDTPDTVAFYVEGKDIVNVDISEINSDSWYHVALVYDASSDKGVGKLFINGVLKATIIDITKSTNTFPYTLISPDIGCYMDELRISDIARPLDSDGKFPVHTKPYSVAVPTGKVAINNAITKMSQLTNDSGFITDVPVATTAAIGGVKPDGTTITVTEDGTISATSSAPDNMMTTNTFQEISARKDFNDSVWLNSEVRLSSITLKNGATGIAQGTSESGSGVRLSDYTSPAEVWCSKFNINTVNPNSGGQGPATLNGKQIATTDDIAAASSSVASVNTKTGAVVLTGADIQTTYTANPDITETTTSDVNSALTQVCEDIHNVLTNVPTGSELMSTTIYPYQAPLATDATLTDVITKVNTILAIMSERGIMNKNS